VNPLEEGTELTLDFQKLRKVAETGEAVIPVVLQHADTGAVLCVAYVNQLALSETLKTGTAVLWSTSRSELWRKGDSSGDVLELVDVAANCEQNSLLYRVRPRGGVCHTRDPDGNTRPTCYYRRLTQDGKRLQFVDA
jgi:phosphoribosyl-AMP cyclohydrolase